MPLLMHTFMQNHTFGVFSSSTLLLDRSGSLDGGGGAVDAQLQGEGVERWFRELGLGGANGHSCSTALIICLSI